MIQRSQRSGHGWLSARCLLFPWLFCRLRMLFASALVPLRSSREGLAFAGPCAIQVRGLNRGRELLIQTSGGGGSPPWHRLENIALQGSTLRFSPACWG
eukprot:6062072-Pyramimonas_sp.AAC.1